MAERFIYRVLGIDVEDDGEERREEHATARSREDAVTAAREALATVDPPYDRVIVERRPVTVGWEHVMTLEATDAG